MSLLKLLKEGFEDKCRKAAVKWPSLVAQNGAKFLYWMAAVFAISPVIVAPNFRSMLESLTVLMGGLGIESLGNLIQDLRNKKTDEERARLLQTVVENSTELKEAFDLLLEKISGLYTLHQTFDKRHKDLNDRAWFRKTLNSTLRENRSRLRIKINKSTVAKGKKSSATSGAYSPSLGSGKQEIHYHFPTAPVQPNSQLHNTGTLLSTFSVLGNALIALLKGKSIKQKNENSLRDQLLELHRQLLRLQSIVDELGKIDVPVAEDLWRIAGRLMPGPIPGPDNVLAEIEMDQGSLKLKAQNHSTEVSESYKLSLLKRYITIMRDITHLLKGTLVNIFHIQSPDIAESLTQLFRIKISPSQMLTKMQGHKDDAIAKHILTNEELLCYIEATRTLEARGLLQVIDFDARAVAHDVETGLTVFGELTQNASKLIEIVIATRSKLGQFIEMHWPHE